MRRAEFQKDEPEVAAEILSEAALGHLGIVTPDGFPRVVPLNFVVDGVTVFAHGAMTGQRAEILRGSSPVSFTAYIALSVIPSYWLSANPAGAATQFFKSVQIDGRPEVVSKKERRVEILQLLMQKYQPEGGFTPITGRDPVYRRLIDETLIVAIRPERISCKIKLGQDKPKRLQQEILRHLLDRGTEVDRLTASEMRRYCWL